MMVNCDIEVFDRLEDIEVIWREVTAKANLHIYQEFDWIAEWYRLIGKPKGIKPCPTLVRGDDGQPLMLLPLAIERHGSWKRLVWMGAEFFDYHAPILMPEATDKLLSMGMNTFCRALSKALRGVDYVDFQRQPATIGDQTNPLIGLQGIPCTQGAHRTELFGEWATYYQSKRGSRTRHNDRRKRKKLAKQGDLRTVFAETSEDIERLIGAMIRQKQAYADALGERCLISRPGYEDFLRGLATERRLHSALRPRIGR